MGKLTGFLTHWLAIPFNILIIVLLVSCGSQTYHAPVSDVGQPPSIRLDEHVVARGETLYSIAWRYNMDHRELARANGIGNSYRIYPGQRLTLDLSRRPASARPPVAAAKTPATPPRATPSRASTPAPVPKKRSENQTNRASVAPAGSSGRAPSKWQWPAKGVILARFASNAGLNKGIDIGGELGEPVLAAAAGNVVYSGSGLRGYGKLIIVKHSEKYLSAYAHNHRLLVDEGDVVKAGQQIAEMGSSGTDRVKLHFEIRYDGKPVDPLKHLPQR